MTRTFLTSLAGLGSAALLAGALAFQYIGGLAPCHLCILQRWPHLAAVLIALAALAVPGAALAVLGALAALTTAGIGFYHTGVERGWFEGPTDCTGGSLAGLSVDDVMKQLDGAALVRCDAVPWELFGLSMASWNTLASLVLVVVWVMAARRAAVR